MVAPWVENLGSLQQKSLAPMFGLDELLRIYFP